MSFGCCSLVRIDQYRRTQVEAELRSVSNDLLATVDSIMEREGKESEPASRVFFLKMKVGPQVL